MNVKEKIAYAFRKEFFDSIIEDRCGYEPDVLGTYALLGDDKYDGIYEILGDESNYKTFIRQNEELVYFTLMKAGLSEEKFEEAVTYLKHTLSSGVINRDNDGYGNYDNYFEFADGYGGLQVLKNCISDTLGSDEEVDNLKDVKIVVNYKLLDVKAYNKGTVFVLRLSFSADDIEVEYGDEEKEKIDVVDDGWLEKKIEAHRMIANNDRAILRAIDKSARITDLEFLRGETAADATLLIVLHNKDVDESNMTHNELYPFDKDAVADAIYDVTHMKVELDHAHGNRYFVSILKYAESKSCVNAKNKASLF